MRGDSDREWSYVLPTVKHVDLRQLSLKEYLVRFALGAAISIIAGIIGLTVGTRFGGCFLAFPSILPASLTLIQEKESTRRADRNAIGAVLGAAGLVVFAMIGEASFGYIEPYLALPSALIGWLVTACALYAILAYVRPDSCDRRKDLGCRRRRAVARGCLRRVDRRWRAVARGCRGRAVARCRRGRAVARGCLRRVDRRWRGRVLTG